MTLPPRLGPPDGLHYSGDMNSFFRDRLSDLYSPLALAAYAALGAVWFSSVPSLMARDPALGPVAVAATGLFTLAFIGVLWPGDSPRRYWLCVAAMTVGGFGLLWLGPSGASSILLVLLAAVLAPQLDGRALIAALVGINLLLLGMVHWRWQASWESSLANAMGMASFQAFAALLMRYATKAEAMTEALRSSNADLLATRSLLAESTRDAERLRLSRELHDVAGHKLTALKLNLAALARDDRFRDDAGIALCAQLADELLADIRTVVRQLRQDDGIDLGHAISALALPFPRPQVELEISSDARVTAITQAEALLRTVQEALTNAARHSQAQHLWVVLRREAAQLRLDIRDDGRGHGALLPGNGLTGMRERLQAEGGDLTVTRADTGGVHLQAWLPVLS